MRRHILGIVGFALASMLSGLLVWGLGAVGYKRIACGMPLDPRPGGTQPRHTDIDQCTPHDAGQWPTVTLRGVVVDFTPGLDVECGILYPHQIARYRVLEVVSGANDRESIVVEHPYCGKAPLKDLERGQVVELTISIRTHYDYVTYAPGFRSTANAAGPYYIAEGPPLVR
jgi:hypothetical protein